MIGNIFNTVLVYPLLNLLVFVYNYIPDIGIVIILITILVRLALLPSFHKSLKNQKAMQELQPKMNELKERHKDDKEQQAKALMELYKNNKVNPLSSCLPMLVQLPILIALYFVFIQSLNGEALQGLYSFIQAPESIDPMFLNFVDLSQRGNYILAALAGGFQYLQGRLMMPKVQGKQDQMSKMFSYQTLYFFPILTFIIGIQFPAGLPLYWLVTTLFGVGQQYFINRNKPSEALTNV
jgi:YidC/Oxa1 family membrane protein insertase